VRVTSSSCELSREETISIDMAQTKNSLDLGKELVTVGAAVVKALRSESPDALDQLDQYSTLFDAWQKSWSRGSGGGVRFSAKEHALGQRISEQHTTVLALTEKMYRSVEDSLRGLRGRSKGIRAYLDHFPSKISTIRTRKG
jgi:hypothetical protein